MWLRCCSSRPWIPSPDPSAWMGRERGAATASGFGHRESFRSGAGFPLGRSMAAAAMSKSLNGSTFPLAASRPSICPAR
jgi:hypothetical protein